MVEKKNILIADFDEYLRNGTTVAQLLQIECWNNIDIHTAMKEAVKEYLATDAGKTVLQETCGAFNWGDFALNYNTDICMKHGFIIMNVIDIDAALPLNESLID